MRGGLTITMYHRASIHSTHSHSSGWLATKSRTNTSCGSCADNSHSNNNCVGGARPNCRCYNSLIRPNKHAPRRSSFSSCNAYNRSTFSIDLNSIGADHNHATCLLAKCRCRLLPSTNRCCCSTADCDTCCAANQENVANTASQLSCNNEHKLSSSISSGSIARLLSSNPTKRLVRPCLSLDQVQLNEKMRRLCGSYRRRKNFLLIVICILGSLVMLNTMAVFTYTARCDRPFLCSEDEFNDRPLLATLIGIGMACLTGLLFTLLHTHNLRKYYSDLLINELSRTQELQTTNNQNNDQRLIEKNLKKTINKTNCQLNQRPAVNISIEPKASSTWNETDFKSAKQKLKKIRSNQLQIPNAKPQYFKFSTSTSIANSEFGTSPSTSPADFRKPYPAQVWRVNVPVGNTPSEQKSSWNPILLTDNETNDLQELAISPDWLEADTRRLVRNDQQQYRNYQKEFDASNLAFDFRQIKKMKEESEDELDQESGEIELRHLDNSCDEQLFITERFCSCQEIKLNGHCDSCSSVDSKECNKVGKGKSKTWYPEISV